MSKYLTVLRVEGKLSLRTPDGLFFGIGMPMAVLLLISMLVGNQPTGNGDYTFMQTSYPALATVGICATAFMGLPLTISDYRDKKILKHFFTTPTSPLLLLGVHVTVCVLTALASALGVTLVATLVLDYRMPGSWLGFIGSYFLVMLAMYSIGMMMASLCQTIKQANVVCNLVYFPMLFLSGAVIPFEIFPDGMHKIASILPLTQGIRLLKLVSLEGISSLPLFSLLYLLIFGILGILVSVKTFRWE